MTARHRARPRRRDQLARLDAARARLDEAIRHEFTAKLPPMLSVAELAELTRSTSHAVRGLVQSGTIAARFSDGKYEISVAENWETIRKLRPRLLGGPSAEGATAEEAAPARTPVWIDAELARALQQHLLRTGEDLETVVARGLEPRADA
ncbi:hypothetical protein ABIQ69_02490 [Agromyces sp. G08B096]|uniref:DNA-binding protein n=1 Tax=Agromyces sp. G08B096 TaxID=3156399 RepID=A0AAU7W912_9MICO